MASSRGGVAPRLATRRARSTPLLNTYRCELGQRQHPYWYRRGLVMTSRTLRIAQFANVVLFALVMGVFWGTWFSLSRSIAYDEIAADTA
jgi:hypothetical protein